MDKSYNIFKIKTLLLFTILIYISLNLIFLSEEYSEDGQLIVILFTLYFLIVFLIVFLKRVPNGSFAVTFAVTFAVILISI